jgi:uncharacterized protein
MDGNFRQRFGLRDEAATKSPLRMFVVGRKLVARRGALRFSANDSSGGVTTAQTEHSSESMRTPRPRLLRENNPDFPAFVLGGTHIRDVPSNEEPCLDQVLVSLPWSYNSEPERTYPTVYLCDGFWDFPLVWGMYSHLLYDKVVPEHILVGLSYGGAKPDVDALRKIDLAPPAANSHDDYLARLKSSVIPFVEAEYGVDPSFRCIAGVSIGGAFALNALFREPGLFQGAIALSPTTEYFDRWLFRLEQQYAEANTNLVSKLLARRKELPVRIFMAAGAADDPGVVRGIQEFDRQLESRRYRFFEKHFRLIDGEKHGALKPEGFNRGLRHVFAPLVNLGPA